MASRYRLALLGMVPIVVLLVSINIATPLTTLLGLPKWPSVLVAFILVVVGFFTSRAILRRGFAQSDP